MKKGLCFYCLILWGFYSVFLLLSCVSTRQEVSVYTLLPDEQVSDGIDGGGDMEYGFTFRNETEKEVQALQVCLSIFDDEGESASYSDCITVDFEKEIEAAAEAHFSIDLSDFFEAEREGFYTVDFIYASSITYADGSVWEDFLGVYATRN